MGEGQIRTQSLFHRVLKGEQAPIPPIWFMRQAGRYLPEYREVRAKAGSFLNLCFNPELASEVTLQPIRRYDFDAAILFADILLIPHALGQELSFEEGEGPKLAPVVSASDLDGFSKQDVLEPLSAVFETVRMTRVELAETKSLIGFAGAPWTVATYMLAGGSVRDPAALRAHAYRDPNFMNALLDLLADKTIGYLCAQIEAGADAIQIFDTWAQGLPETLVDDLSLRPMEKIARGVKQQFPQTPIILFPRGVGTVATKFAALDVCDGISIDTTTPWDWARAHLSPHAVVQGGLDPLLTVEGGERMLNAAANLLRDFDGAPYIFNLGHGFTPQTPPENVKALVDFVRSGDWRAGDAS